MRSNELEKGMMLDGRRWRGRPRRKLMSGGVLNAWKVRFTITAWLRTLLTWFCTVIYCMASIWAKQTDRQLFNTTTGVCHLHGFEMSTFPGKPILAVACITWCGALRDCLAVKFDSCNNLLSSVHTMTVKGCWSKRCKRGSINDWKLLIFIIINTNYIQVLNSLYAIYNCMQYIIIFVNVGVRVCVHVCVCSALWILNVGNRWRFGVKTLAKLGTCLSCIT